MLMEICKTSHTRTKMPYTSLDQLQFRRVPYLYLVITETIVSMDISGDFFLPRMLSVEPFLCTGHRGGSGMMECFRNILRSMLNQNYALSWVEGG